jgi:hypothetical protein
MAEQAKIEAQLLELEGMRDIQVGLEVTHINEDEQMCVDKAPEPRPIEAKLRALEKFVRVAPPFPFPFPLPHYLCFAPGFILFILMVLFQGSAIRQQYGDKVPGLSLEEAVELEQQAHAADLERKRRLLERRQKQGLVTVKDRTLSREEQEARIWAFMCDDLADLITTDLVLMSATFRNYKPSESDLEDDDDDISEDEDPSTWFYDDQDDGRKGQDIIEPDAEDISDLIRVDASRIYYNTFYES